MDRDGLFLIVSWDEKRNREIMFPLYRVYGLPDWSADRLNVLLRKLYIFNRNIPYMSLGWLFGHVPEPDFSLRNGLSVDKCYL